MPRHGATVRTMQTVQDLIDEAKVRAIWWALCIFAVSYFLSHTSKSMWMNLPVAILFVSALRIVFNEVEFSWKARLVRSPSYLSHLRKRQLSVNDSRLNSAPPPPRWNGKIDSPVVEDALSDFIDKILRDFVVDLWYSDISPDREFPEQIRAIIMDALGEISGRVKDINLVNLLTRDIVDLVGDHLDLFRRNQAAIGVDVMGTLSSEERDERLKHHLLASRELHPALVSPESEYKVLQRLMSGLLTVVLRPRETQCPVVRSIARELLTCVVIQPIMSFASPGYVNEVIEYVFLAASNDSRDGAGGVCDGGSNSNHGKYSTLNKGGDEKVTEVDKNQQMDGSEPLQQSHAEWARMLDAVTQRRTEVLMPENLENMWTKGRNYKKRENKDARTGAQGYYNPTVKFEKQTLVKSMSEDSMRTGDKAAVHPLSGGSSQGDGNEIGTHNSSQNLSEDSRIGGVHPVDELKGTGDPVAGGNRSRLKRSSSTSALKVEPDTENVSRGVGPIISDFYSPTVGRASQEHTGMSASDMVVRREGQALPKLRCRVMGAYFEKLGSKSFAVYSIAVTGADKRTWFVKRRYRNFERLHRHLKDIPNYTLHLPPKRIFSSSTEDTFVHQRCIQLDRYLQDLLAIANVAEQHEVWDFLSVSSKNYSFGKSSSVMRTLAVNVDDAVDDIVRQFKGVSDGLMRKVVGSTSPNYEASSSVSSHNLYGNPEVSSEPASRQYSIDLNNSFSENEEGDKIGSHGLESVSGWHSDNELNSKSFPPRVVKRVDAKNSGVEKKIDLEVPSRIGHGGSPYFTEDPTAVPPEWTPPNVSVPLLNLVDKIFQLKRRGWIRRQVFWISKQILQLIMEDAIDDWLLRQINWLRREDIIAQGVRWVQDILWPGGTFFTRIGNTQAEADAPQTSGQTSGRRISMAASFEEQLEAARRASDVKKILFDGAPSTLVSLLGQKQYRRCARDMYYFTQSTVCVKQLAYGILELLLVSVFPELQTVVLELHEKANIQPFSSSPPPPPPLPHPTKLH